MIRNNDDACGKEERLNPQVVQKREMTQITNHISGFDFVHPSSTLTRKQSVFTLPPIIPHSKTSSVGYDLLPGQI